MAIFSGIRELKETISSHSSRELVIPDEYTVHPGDDHRFMARALKLADKGVFTTHPNPRVGCVITKNGVVVGEGYHKFAGQAHAEIHALKQAGKYARGSTLYVNLEPCCHHGRTPPCTDAIIKSGVSRVVIAMEDPNPLVNRAGISVLKKAGIIVETGINHDRAMRLNRGFIKRIIEGKPWVTLKIAVSLDGKTALQSGDSQWITSEPARLDAHRLRAASSAILTGVGTVLRDDPEMTARVPEVERQPLRVILDSRLSTPANAKILNAKGAALIMTAPNMLSDAEIYPQKNVEVIGVPMKGSAIDINEVLLELGRREVNDLMLEAGSRLSGALLEQSMVDEVVVYMAPDLLGSDARGMFRIPGIEEMHDKHLLEFTDIRKVGRDIRLNLQTRADTK